MVKNKNKIQKNVDFILKNAYNISEKRRNLDDIGI